MDVEPVAAVRERFGDDLLLQVDANAAYTLDDAEHLAALDPFDLLLIEQPLAEDDLRHHAAAGQRGSARRSASTSRSPRPSGAADAIALGACSIVNIKAGRVGGYLEAKRVHDVCQVHGVPVWCGGMLETGLGRAGQRRARCAPRLHAARRHVGVRSLLGAGPHRAVRAPTTATSPCRPAPASASTRSRTSSPS